MDTINIMITTSNIEVFDYTGRSGSHFSKYNNNFDAIANRSNSNLNKLFGMHKVDLIYLKCIVMVCLRQDQIKKIQIIKSCEYQQ